MLKVSDSEVGEWGEREGGRERKRRKPGRSSLADQILESLPR